MTEPTSPPAPVEETVICSSCGEMSPAGLSWCEACGHDLSATPKPVCVGCGESAVEPDGYCHSCGRRQPAERDHLVRAVGEVAAVSDRGKRHHHNEDAVAVAEVNGNAVVVICDGVSSTPGSADVSLAAAAAAVEVLSESVAAGTQLGANGDGPNDDGPNDDGPNDDTAMEPEMEAALVAAVEAAQSAAIVAADGVGGEPANPPSTTFVAAVAKVNEEATEAAVSVAWLGDSRAYWIDGDTAHLLTIDHEIDGALSRWLGPDAGDFQPDLAHHRFPDPESHSSGIGSETTLDTEPSMLMVCSDGLWRYFAPETGEPAETLVSRLRSNGLGGTALAEGLVAFANEKGGHDNITVGLWPTTSSTPEPERTTDRGEESQA